jgi:hypothetical protein
MADALQDQVLAVVPESGEVEFSQLVVNLHSAGAHHAPEQLLRLKHQGVLKYRLARQEDGTYNVMVSRVGGAS